MTSVRRLIVGGILAMALLVAPAAPAAAETTVSTKGNVVAITIPVDIVGAEGQTGPDGTPLIDYWTKIVNDAWQGAFNQLPYKNCFKLELKLKLKARGDDFDSTKGRHRILVGAASGGTFRGTGFDGTKETSRNPKTGDGTRALENDLDGAIPVDAPATVVEHEFGHLFGLGDDRENGKAKSGRDGTLMVGGAEGVDPNRPLRIDKNLIDRLGKLIEQHLKNRGKQLPKCETWKGTLTSEHTVAGTCTFTWSGTYTFGVVEGAVIGTATISPDGRCPAYGGPVTITGTETNDGFTLTSESFIFANADVPKTAPDHAEGTATYTDQYNVVTTTFKMDCVKNCAGENAG